MSRAEIRKKFDEIVDFAEVEKFLDTPVKHYSSGMYVRLAFAVAAHLEPEILIVDEVLAVGDAAFQKKCLGKMEDVAEKEGRTVLFVSHNMAAVKTICKKLMWIDQGNIKDFSDSVEEVIYSYFQIDQVNQKHYSSKWSLEEAPGNENVKIREVKVSTNEEIPTSNISINTPIKIECIYDFLIENALFYFGCNILDITGEVVFMAMSQPQKITRGLYQTTCHIPKNLLNNRKYSTQLYWTIDGSIVIYQIKDLIRFEVQDIEREFGAWMGEYFGLVRPLLNWETIKLD
jgi:lipopolysaccharide transport system ATP-binding protein